MSNENSEKKKIVFLSHGLGSGGIESFIVTAMTGLNEKGKYELILIEAYDDNTWAQFKDKELLSRNIRILRTCDIHGKKDIFRHLSLLYKLLKELKPDVFHANMDMFNGLNLFVAKLAGVPIRASHSHTSGSRFETASKTSVFSKIYKACMRKMIWWFSNRRIGCSEDAMNYLYKGKWKGKKNSIILYNGIDVKKFSSKMSSADMETKKEELGISDVKNVLMTTGRFSPEKNPLFTIEVIKHLSKKMSDFKFLWIGNGPQFEEAANRAKEEGVSENILFLGLRNDVNEILQCARLFLLPSIYEGLGIALIEAQAARVFCLASESVPGFVNCGLCEFLPIDSPEKWANRIVDFFGKSNDFELDENRLSEFDSGSMVDHLEAFYFKE